MAVRIQFRRGTAAEWASANPTLAAGELGYETDTAQIKIGNGTTDWDNLAYAAVSASYIDDAIANVVGLSPETLDTLEELANSINNDPDVFNTISDSIANAVIDHNLSTDVHGIPDTAELETKTGAQTKANNAQSNAASYTDSAIANLIDSSPSTLNTLNELAAALGDDPNYATTISTALGERLQFVVDTAANFVSDNTVISSNVLAIESDTNYVKLGDGLTAWNDLFYVGEEQMLGQIYIHANDTSVHGIENTANIVMSATLEASVDALSNTITDSIQNHNLVTTNVHGIANTADLITTSDLETAVSGVNSNLLTHSDTSLNVHGIANTALLATMSYVSSEIGLSISDHNAEVENVHGFSNTVAFIATVDSMSVALSNVETSVTSLNSTVSGLAPIDSPTFSGNVVLPVSTTLGNISSTELGYLDNVSSNIQAQLDGKLDTSVASTTYAPIANPDFTGDVVFNNASSLTIPANSNFSFGGLTGFVAGSYLAGVSQDVQAALNNALYTAGGVFELPYGTSIGNTTFDEISSLQGLDTTNVYSTQFNYLAGATSNIQDQLDAKAPIANAVFTGSTEAVDFTVTGNLIVQGTTTTISTSNLQLQDNMVYLNQAGLATLTNAVGDGTNVVYTTEAAHGFEVGFFVTIANTTPSSFDYDSTGAEILAVTENTFTIASTVTDSYVSGGTARGKVHSNPDLGWAAGRYADNTYAHAGVFRDATDGVFKFFDGYVPEPDESVFINTSDNTFALAPIEAATVSAADFLPSNAIVFADNTVQTSAGVASITGFTEKTANYQLDSLTHKDNVVEMNSSSALTFTIPLESTFSWPIGASMDIIQTGAGQVTITGEAGVTLNYTPGNKLRTQWSSCTIMKRAADSWILYGDLTA